MAWTWNYRSTSDGLFIGLVRAAAVVFLSIGCYVCQGADQGPWPFPELAHRRHFVLKPEKGTAHQAGVVGFSTGNVMHPEGRDVHVLAGAGEVPCRVLQMGPGSVCRLAFEVRPEVEDYYVFYGSRDVTADIPSWRPHAGLILETRRFNGGSFNTYHELQRVVRESGPPFGTGIVTQVYHGHNPFGPSDNYVSVYEGTLWVEQAGQYVLATTSDDASVMRVDGKVVAEKYGYGPAVADARFAGKPVTLSAGGHIFEYYHVEVLGEQAAVAAWQPPGGKMQVIPPKAFGTVISGRPVSYAVRGQALAPEITAVNSGEVIFRDSRMTRFSFQSTPLDPDVFQFKHRWDFGDGTSSRTVNPEHIYFEFDTYDVTLTLARGPDSYSISHTTVVDEGWERQTVGNNDNLQQYCGIIKGYQFENMEASAIDRAMDVFEELDAHDEILRVSGVMLAREEELDDPIRLRHTLLRTEALCKEKVRREKEPKEKVDDGTVDEYEGVDFFAEALALLTDAEERLRDTKHKVKVALKKADVYFYYVRDLEKARGQYERILESYHDVEADEVRTAQIRLGDCFRKEGETDNARAAYEKANKMMSYKRPYSQDKARLGAMQESAENYVRRGELDAAREQLDIWEWEYPEEKLEGRCSLLRADLAVKEKNPEEALVQLQDLVSGNKESAFAPEALLRIAELQMELAGYEKALAACERILSDYPDSPLKEDAGFLGGECLFNEKRYQKALARLEDLAATYVDSPRLPGAMLIIGDCHLKLGKRGKARDIWQQLVERFPGSDEGKKAEERLKD